MSEITAISPADLRAIERYLERIALATRDVHANVEEVNGRVAHVQSQQATLAHDLAELAGEFASFVQADAKQKSLQLAETRIVKVRQELENTFGYYAEVRRRATGILQALDAGLVTHDTVQHTTEDVMMSAPGYWLAPALVGLAAWIRGDKDTADRAVRECLRRDDYKASLYFLLVLHRYDRRRAAAAWLHRFFSHQNPAGLDREFVVLLDVVANGFFGPEARAVSDQYIGEWLRELSQYPGFLEEQEGRWVTALAGLRPAIGGEAYATLARCSPTWETLRESLSYAHLHGCVADHFQEIFAGEIVPLPRLATELDLLLKSLVTNFDDEELPLRMKERELQHIIDADGDRQLAERRFAAERQAFAERVSFTALLTNAAMHPEISKASLATRRYGVALSREWIVGAYERLTRKGREIVPLDIVIRIEGWQGVTRDGLNERELLTSLQDHLRRSEQEAAAQITLPVYAMLAPFLGGALLVYGVIQWFSMLAFLVGAGALIYWYVERGNVAKRLAELAERFRRAREDHARSLSQALAEVARYRGEINRLDAEFAATHNYLASISPDQSAFARVSDASPALV